MVSRGQCATLPLCGHLRQCAEANDDGGVHFHLFVLGPFGDIQLGLNVVLLAEGKLCSLMKSSGHSSDQLNAKMFEITLA